MCVRSSTNLLHRELVNERIDPTFRGPACGDRRGWLAGSDRPAKCRRFSQRGADGRIAVRFSIGPGGRVRADGPGTHTQVAEMVGVRANWDLFLTPVGGGPVVQLTHDASLSNKESEWIRVSEVPGSN